MFGNVQEPMKPEPAVSKPLSSSPNLADQAHAFFASCGAKVSTPGTPRSLRPGYPGRQVPAPAPRPAQPAPFADSSDDAARARAEAMAAEADIVDDNYFECDAPGL